MKYDQVPNSLFKKNRKKFMTQMKAKSIAVFNSNDIYPISADGTMPFEGEFDAAVGVEYKPLEMLAVRTGWSLSAKDTADNAGGGFVDAMGFGMGTKYNQFSLDYAWKPYADLGNTHRISLGMDF